MAFKGVSERFKVSMVGSDDMSQPERVTVQIGLDGLKVLNNEGTRTMRNYELAHIARWQHTGSSLVLYTKTPVDLEERQLTLLGDSRTIQTALDTLTCCCMQMVEILQSGQTAGEQEAANSLHALVAGGGTKKSVLPTADSIQYWRDPDKAGWLLCQGEVMKTWRKRWFVLKQGHLFRFMGPDVSETTKPRGVVDLSKVQDVRDGRAATGRPNSIQLKTATGGSVAYLTESETETVEWISALEGAVAHIVKALAGLEEDGGGTKGSSAKAAAGRGGDGDRASDYARHLERLVDRSGAGGGAGAGPTMVNVVGYEGNGYGGRAGGGGGGSDASSSGRYGGGDTYGRPSGIDYGQIMGVAGVAGGASTPADDLSLNYGGYGGSSHEGRYGNSGSAGYGGATGAAATGGTGSHSAPPYGSYTAAALDPYASGGSYGAGNGYGQSGGGYAQGGPSYGQGGGGGYSQAPGYYPPPQQQPASAYAAPAVGHTSSAAYAAPAVGHTSSAPPLSLLDQVPSQQPAYPSYYQPQQEAQQQAPQQQQAATGLPSGSAVTPGGWQVLHTPDGRAYYYHAATSTTQWDAPAGL